MEKSVSIFVPQIDWVSLTVEEKLKDRKVSCTRVEKQEYVISILLYHNQLVSSCLSVTFGDPFIFRTTFCVPKDFGMA